MVQFRSRKLAVGDGGGLVIDIPYKTRRRVVQFMPTPKKGVLKSAAEARQEKGPMPACSEGPQDPWISDNLRGCNGAEKVS